MNIRQTISIEFWNQHGNVSKLARKAGIDRKTVRRFLFSDDDVTISTYLKMCDALDLELVVRKKETI